MDFTTLLNPPPQGPAQPLVPEHQRVWDALLAHTAARAAPERWAELNTDFTSGEVLAAVMRCGNGKAADLEGLTAEGLKLFLMHAGTGSIVLDLLTSILNACHDGGLPPQACTSKLVPVPKGAAGMDPQNYRGIAV